MKRGARVVLLACGSLLVTLGFFALAVAGWGGGWGSFLSDPVRRASFVAGLLLSTAGGYAMARSPEINPLSSGLREDRTNRWLFLPNAVLVVLIVWLPPLTDRRDLLTFDGDTVRWIGFALFVLGALLRMWPVLVLGRHYSVLLAIQEHHDLVTDGPYRWVRHPFYLGSIVNAVGWALVFRSSFGLLLAAAAVALLVPRMRAEEALLESHFGDAYAAYRLRSWRLVPLLY